jgi:DisA bacterial checkpoint controller nucleotide-binding
MGLDAEEIAWQRLGAYRDLDEFRRRKAFLAPEIYRCFSPVVREGHRRPYGAVVARYDNPGELGTLHTIANTEELLAAADGVNAIAYIVKDQPLRLLRLAKPLDSQDACCHLADWLEGVVTRVDPDGMIWVASPKAVTTIDHLNGWTRPPIDDILSVLNRLLPDADSTTLNGFARLAYSYLSPRKVGTMLLLSLIDSQSSDHQTNGTSIADLSLNVQRPRDWPLIEHELRHCDGAAVVHGSGLLLRKGVILNSTEVSQANVETEGGTRHNSAARHTFDRPDLLAAVVSSDGPVTIFSDGVRASRLVLPQHGLPWNPSGGEMWAENTRCPKCGSTLVVRKIVLYGFRESEEGWCPICSSRVAAVHGWAVEVALIKDTATIERLLELRRRGGTDT